MSAFLTVMACAGLTALLIRHRIQGQSWPNGALLVEAMQLYLTDDPADKPADK